MPQGNSLFAVRYKTKGNGREQNMMRGTTPTHTFNIPFDVENVEEVKVIYMQGDKQVMCKGTAECNMSGNTISVKLTQEETFLFDSEKHCKIQIRVLTKDGTALASNIYTVNVRECLDDEVLS